MFTYVPDFTAPEYQRLCSVRRNNATIHHAVLLAHVVRVCGLYPTLKQHVCWPTGKHKMEPLDVMLPRLGFQDAHVHDADYVKKVYVQLGWIHARFGNKVVHFQQVFSIYGIPQSLEFLDNLPYSTKIHIISAAFVHIQFIFTVEKPIRFVNSNLFTYTHPPSFEFTPKERTFVCGNKFKARLFTLTSGLFPHNDFDWSNVMVAGGLVSACFTPPPPASAPKQVHEAFDSMDIDLFVTDVVVLARVLHYFEQRFNSKVLFGINHGVVVVAIQQLSRIVQVIVIPPNSTLEKTLVNFDLDYCQIAFNGKHVRMTQRALWAIHRHCCTVSTMVLANRQYKTLKKGYGLKVLDSSTDLIHADTYSKWENIPYVHVPNLPLRFLTYVLQAQFACSNVFPAVTPMMEAFLDTLFYVPTFHYVSVKADGYNALQTPFLNELFKLTLQQTIPDTQQIEHVLLFPVRIVFNKRPWLVCRLSNNILLRSCASNYVAEGYNEIQRFLRELRKLMERAQPECYWDNTQYDVLNVINPGQGTRIFDMKHSRILESLPMLRNTCVCARLHFHGVFFSPALRCYRPIITFGGNVDILPLAHVAPGY